jgi:anti-sigma B factor antagonist
MDLGVDNADEQSAVSKAQIDGMTVVSVTGEVDVANVRHLRRELLLAVRDDDRHVVVDLTGATYLDSAGLGALIGARRRLRASGGRTLHLVVNRDRLLSLFAITHLDRAFSIHATLPEALAARASSQP